MKPASDCARAVELRKTGVSYAELMRRFGVAKSTLWRWLKAEGLVAATPQQFTELRRLAQQKATVIVRRNHATRTAAILEQAKGSIGQISLRELWLIGIALYWAEGAKQKPHNPAQRMAFSNSDPAMLKTFIQWLREACHIPSQDLAFELYIHESANREAARRFWSAALHVPLDQWRIRLKRHRISTRRRNVGPQYVGLVRISVARSTQFNRKIAGWISGIIQSIQNVGESANGKPSDFGSEYPGSIPGSPANSGELNQQRGDDPSASLVSELITADYEGVVQIT